jgi:hypothetical protein
VQNGYHAGIAQRIWKIATRRHHPSGTDLDQEKGFGQTLAPRNIDLTEHLLGAPRVHHRHMGMNLALGGVGNPRFTHEHTGEVEGDGSDGHMYIYYMAPKPARHGGLLIGVEGSAAGLFDVFGHQHTAKAISSDISPAGGAKWRKLGMGPMDANDDLLVDLSTGWQFLPPLRFAGGEVRQTSINPKNAGLGGGRITYIPPLKDWKKMTKGTKFSKRGRSSISDVDPLIRRYEGAADRVRANLLPALEDLVNEYVEDQLDKGGDKSKRTGGAQRIQYLIALEKERLDI